jgi:predicted  nucleic acid-binding Zn-ribbon protein
MKRNKLLFVKRLNFVIFFVLLGALNLYAEDEPDFAEELSALKKEISVLKEKDATIENDNSELSKNISKIDDSLRHLSDSASTPQIWQIIPTISVALIALLLLGVVVLILLKQLRLHVVVEHDRKLADEKPVKEYQPAEESKALPQGISSFELDTLKKDIKNVQNQLAKLNDTVNIQSENSSRFQSNLTSFQTEMTDFKQTTQTEITGLKQTIKNANDAVSSLKTDIDKNREKLAKKERVESDPVSVFNQWAQNPHMPFPQYFTYVTNVKLEFRTKQEFTDTTTETEWIRNTIGEKKYLFPNPNKIDNLSGPIDKLYKVAGTRKAKGTNSVKITSACQIKEGNFIEYQGELTLM